MIWVIFVPPILLNIQCKFIFLSIFILSKINRRYSTVVSYILLLIQVGLNLYLAKKGTSLCLVISLPTGGAPRGLGDLGRRAIYFQGAGEHC